MDTIENTEYDGETIEELLPPESVDGRHRVTSPSRDYLREIGEHHGPEAIFGMKYSIRTCGVWTFCKEEDGVIVEQCDGCGTYRRREKS